MYHLVFFNHYYVFFYVFVFPKLLCNIYIYINRKSTNPGLHQQLNGCAEAQNIGWVSVKVRQGQLPRQAFRGKQLGLS
jgi:hypothetical protein